ncbi:hypothetical protein DHL47_08645 [Streptococcus panodentis]|uniref:Uncharacterized protein n=1 Tax=Streptococcus panodentis TaxID=1581472 RepID=A0ABS5AXT5_9STRE|nr:hypothetical protein [Streptococcus panodentis]
MSLAFSFHASVLSLIGKSRQPILNENHQHTRQELTWLEEYETDKSANRQKSEKTLSLEVLYCFS